MSEEYKYVWESRRGVYRVVIDRPVYSRETKKTTHHYETVGKASEKGGPIEFGPRYKAIQKVQSQNGNLSAKSVELCGEKLVLEKASAETGLGKALSKAFGKEMADRIFGLACYLVCTGDALSNASLWQEERGMKTLDAPRVSELLPKLSEESCSAFFRSWTADHVRNRTLCYDITSVSTYARDMSMAEFGYNRDHERWLRQINLAMLTDKDSHMPLAFRIVNGSLGDVQTLKDTVRELSMYGATPYGMVMDRGFWSSEKLQMLTDAGIRYMIPVPNSVGWARKLIARMKNDVFSNPAHTDDDGTATYGCTVSDPTDAGRRIWAHVFYSPSMETEQKQRFVDRYMAYRKELQDNEPNEKHQSFYDEYFTVSTRGRGGRRHVVEKTPLSDILREKDFGYWVLYTDMEKDAFKALADYRDRNFIEAGFDDLKGSTDAKRLRVHHDRSVHGRIFLQFCAQILRTQIRSEISGFDQETRKYASNPDSLLSRVRMYSKVSYTGRYRSQYTVMTKGQRLIFKALKIHEEAADTDENRTEELLS